MNSAELERLRLSLLQTLNAVAGSSLPVDTLVLGARMAGFAGIKAEAISAELAYMADKQFVALTDKSLSPENREWRITAAGRDYLATRGL